MKTKITVLTPTDQPIANAEYGPDDVRPAPGQNIHGWYKPRRRITWKRWSLLMIALTLAFLAFGYRHQLWEWWHFQVHQPISQEQYEAL